MLCRLALLLVMALLFGCGGGASSGASTATPSTSVDPPIDLYAFQSTSPYAEVLAPCVLAETRLDACYLRELPLIGRYKSTISRADILERLVVSHDWMGQRFSDMLAVMPDEVVQLFGALSAVVIAYDIRPSYYWRLTNTIYIDPADLWLTNSEKATIAQDPDYRSGFGSKLKFISTWDYMNGRSLAWNYIPLDSTEERSLDEIIAPNAQLFLHELSHANDVFPPALWGTIDHSKKPDLAAQDVESQWASTRLSAFYPLRSELLYDVANVLFFGDDASEDILQLSATELGIAFEADDANDDYNYASIREDVAMIFEEAMMWHLFSLDRIVAYLDTPSVDAPVCEDYNTAWGQRGRISQTQLAARVRLVIQHILPNSDADAILAGLPPTIQFTPGQSYCANIIASANQRDLVSRNISKLDNNSNVKNITPTFNKKQLRLQ